MAVLLHNPSVAVLVEQALAGNRQAFDTLEMRHHDGVYRRAFQLLGDPWEAEDTTQDVFLRAYTHLSEFRGDSKFSTWLYRITTNTAWMRLRAKRVRQSEAHVDEESLALHPSRFADPLRALLASEGLRLLDLLPVELSQLIYMRIIEGLSYEEIAVRTEKPIGTVKSRLHRIRDILNKEWEK